MSDDFDLEIQSRNGSHLIVARAFGVVVRDQDLQAGIQKAVDGIAEVRQRYRDVGLEPQLAEEWGANSNALPREPRRTPSFARLMEMVPQALVSGVIISGLILLASVPLFSVLARLNRTLEGLTTTTSSAAIQNAGRNTIDLIIRTGDMVDRVSPERKQELRLAVRKIMNGLAPIIEEVGDSREPDAPTPPPAR